MIWSEWILLAACIAAAYGVHLNVNRDRRCFHLWIASNSVQIAFAVWLYIQTGHKGALANAALFAYYLIQAARGLLKWRKEP